MLRLCLNLQIYNFFNLIRKTFAKFVTTFKNAVTPFAECKMNQLSKKCKMK